ncbi:hypothetical protein HDG34_005644 [Paraburkholderia sp. HC6.4b]|uniref:N-acetylmuramidase domain-containing protein n=1 Tax=unclassified Paraburkholderia TaxID=2615204 RepID=UPI00161DED27|nr:MULTISPECIES: N-acetylmuramidase domain-containing protein [unclassified Paraburkholderia]MBB5411683.1 hypothetical protein [Paraburkholderia sp. HC6.4b]MBB5453288.1 hypothetical protein [Paraburkholderia sp. Kb1A]
MNFTGKGAPLTAAGLESARSDMQVDVECIWALIHTETVFPHAGFWQNRSPQMLYEQRVFHEITRGLYDQTASDISSTTPGYYGDNTAADQYRRLNRAIFLDEDAALKSASWGLGQVLGRNFDAAGYGTVDAMLSDMVASEDSQLLATARFIISSEMDGSLACLDWTSFAAAYNGDTTGRYAGLISGAYAKYKNGGVPDIDVRAAQIYLMYLGIDAEEIDGILLDHTASALRTFQSTRGLPVTGQLDPNTFSRLEAEAMA